MANLVPQVITGAGVAPSFTAAAAGGDTIYQNNGNAVLHVKNGDTSPHTVTIVSTKLCDQGFTHNDVVVVANAAEAIIGPFPVARFGRSVSITYSAVTSVTVACYTD